MTIRIKKPRQHSKPEWLIIFMLVMPFLISFLTELLPFPSAVKYTIDLGWLLLVLFMVRSGMRLPNRYSQHLLIVVLAFFAFTVVGFLLGYQSVLYYVWGFRNNARFFVFFFACILFLNSESVDPLLQLMDTLFVINFFITLYQFFILDISQDYLGGIFGVESGCNGYTNIFLLIVITRSVLRYLNYAESTKSCLMKCAMALLITALAELKIFLVEFVLIIFLAMLVTKHSQRKLLLICAACIGLVLSMQLLVTVFPYWAGKLNLAEMWEEIASDEGYTDAGDLNRMTAVPDAMAMFLHTLPQKLFGLGLGNCDTSSFSFLNTPFYEENSWLHYSWFSSSFLVLETGLVGLVLYVLFFLLIFFAVRNLEHSGKGHIEYCQLASILSLICLVLIIYNISLRTEAGYMMFFMLALPFIKDASNDGHL